MMKPLQLSDAALALFQQARILSKSELDQLAKSASQLNEEQDDLAAIVYEDLIADIKSTLESPFTSDAMKLKYIRQSFQDYDL